MRQIARINKRFYRGLFLTEYQIKHNHLTFAFEHTAPDPSQQIREHSAHEKP